MDFMTILGFLVGGGAVYFVMVAGGIQELLFNREAAILVFGGTLGCLLITSPWSLLRHLPRAVRLVLFPGRRETAQIVVDTVVGLSEKSRRGGMDSLAAEIPALPDRFLQDAVQMLVDGLPAEVVRDNLEKEIVFTRKRHQQISNLFATMGTYAPIFGLLGTLIGVVQVLKDLSDPKTMGASMAIAVTTTFYGIFATNFIFLPIAGKLNIYSEEELLIKEVVIEGILSIQQGDIPIIVSRKLQAFLAYRLRSAAPAARQAA